MSWTNDIALRYYQLIYEGKMDEAKRIRHKTIPKVLSKFIALSNNENENEKRFFSLENNKIWISSIDAYNDPFEFRTFYVDDAIVKAGGYDTSWRNAYQKWIYDYWKKAGVASLSKNSFQSLLMWAYYSNNHSGFCVEYDVVDESKIWAVAYTDKRIEFAGKLCNLLIDIFNNIDENNVVHLTPEMRCTLAVLKMQLCSKHSSWGHEKEYRVIADLKEEGNGFNLDLSVAGLRVKRVIAGLNCKKEHVDRLQKISSFVFGKNIVKLQLDMFGKEYALLEEIHNGQDEI